MRRSSHVINLTRSRACRRISGNRT